MFIRQKRSKDYLYLQIVENYRDGNRVKQRVIATLGRLDKLRKSRQLDALLLSAARYCENAAIIGAHKQGQLQEQRSRKLGPGLVFERLWTELGIDTVLQELLEHRSFGFDVERAIFLTAVHRLMEPGSDRAADKWRRDYRLRGVEALELHQLYRAMAWLGEVLTDEQQQAATKHSPRCNKDLFEEKFFSRRRHLFSELVVALFDTTSLYFEGEGGQQLGQRGNSKDRKPQKKQMVLGLIADEKGRPICCEMWPGNTTDVTTLLPLLGRLRSRFGFSKVRIIADRGMFSQPTLAALEKMEGVQYILGARMRKHKQVSQEVLGRAGSYRTVRGPRKERTDPSPLKVKQVHVQGRRFVVCLNEEQARKDAMDRAAIVEKLEHKLRQGPKALVGNKGFKRYLKDAGGRFELDRKKLEAEARLDGKWVLRTNCDAPAEEVALAYKDLWMVEALFRSLKSTLRTRPIFHRRDETIRGHVFCSFLALVLMRELQDRMAARGWQEAEWADVLRDLDNLYESELLTADGKSLVLRSEVKGWAGKVFQAVGVALPPTLRRLEEVAPVD